MTTQSIEILAKAIAYKQPAVLVTVVEVKGATPAKVGAQIVLLEDETTVGTVGGGKLETAIMELFRSASLFLDEGLCEIGGGYLIWLWLRESKNIWFGLIGGIGLLLFGLFRLFSQPSSTLASVCRVWWSLYHSVVVAGLAN